MDNPVKVCSPWDSTDFGNFPFRKNSKSKKSKKENSKKFKKEKKEKSNKEKSNKEKTAKRRRKKNKPYITKLYDGDFLKNNQDLSNIDQDSFCCDWKNDWKTILRKERQEREWEKFYYSDKNDNDDNYYQLYL